MNSDEAFASAVRHHQAGQLAAAEKIYREILVDQPEHFDSLHLLGVLTGQRGGTDAAVELIRKAIAVKPEVAEAHRNLANFLMQMGRMDEAAGALGRAIEIKPDYAEAYNDLGNILLVRNDLNGAIASYGNAIVLKPEFADAHHNLANALSRRGLTEEALAANARAIALKPDWAQAQVNLGEILARAHRHDEAETAYREAIALDPNCEAACYSLGSAMQAQGKFEEAAKCFSQLLQNCSDATFGVVYRNLLETHLISPTAKGIDRLNRITQERNIHVDSRAAASFALGKVLDQAKRFDEAFEVFARANSLAKEMRAAAGEIYEPEIIDRAVNEMIETFTPIAFEQRKDWGDPSKLPVFIVGMPRSGTSLVQQIAASHPSVHGAGELNDIPELMKSLGKSNCEIAGEKSDPGEAYRSAARRHVEHLQSLNPKAKRVIDKMPANIRWLGLIAILFPKARVIFCRREARDTCLSCYFQWFATGNTFSFDLAHCGHEFLATECLRRHWRQVLPLKMLEIEYEKLVSDPEKQSRRLINFLGLGWNSACLDFHKAKTTVLTASSWQVRQPIYQRSVGRWRDYERHLGPLTDIFGGKK